MINARTDLNVCACDVLGWTVCHEPMRMSVSRCSATRAFVHGKQRVAEYLLLLVLSLQALTDSDDR